MIKDVISDQAPKAIGPYTHAKIVKNLLFTSGQIAINPDTNEIQGNTIEEQTVQVCENLKNVLNTANSSFKKVFKTTCFLKNMSDFAKFNEIYEKYFISKPARSCVAVNDLPKNSLVEIELIAEIQKNPE